MEFLLWVVGTIIVLLFVGGFTLRFFTMLFSKEGRGDLWAGFRGFLGGVFLIALGAAVIVFLGWLIFFLVG